MTQCWQLETSHCNVYQSLLCTLATIIDCLISCLYVLCPPLAAWLDLSVPFLSQWNNFSSFVFSQTLSCTRMLDQAEGLHQSPVKTYCASPEPSFDFLLGHSEVELSALLDHSRTGVAILVVWSGQWSQPVGALLLLLLLMWRFLFFSTTGWQKGLFSLLVGLDSYDNHQTHLWKN